MKKLLKFFAFLFITIIFLSAETAAYLYIHYSAKIPKIPLFKQVDLPQVMEIRSAEGHLLDKVGQNRYNAHWEELPANLINAVIASEDASFFQHNGLDFKGILRALLADIVSGRAKQGASTITQQVARNLLLNLNKTMSRKVMEAILARRIEDVYTKDEILLLYLNLIYLGENTYGVKAAARQYFHKDLSELTLGECAILAALPQSPSRVNPVKDPAGIKAKRDRVLRRMLTTGKITQKQYEQALKEPIHGYARSDMFHNFLPWVADTVKKRLPRLIQDGKLREAGLRVWTTESLGTGLMAEMNLRHGVEALNQKQGFRGPVFHVDDVANARSAFQKMQEKPGLTIGLVIKVSKKQAKVMLPGGKLAGLFLKDNRYAGKYQEFRKRKGRYRPGRVSFKRRLRDFRKAVRIGDLVFVRPVKTRKKTHKKRKKAIKKGMKHLALAMPYGMEGALFSLEPCTGEVLAMVGSVDFDLSEFDHSRAKRQSGSTIKPIYYARAYDASIPPSMVFSGVPVSIRGWRPDTEPNLKDMTLWEALTVSENNISLRLYQHLLKLIGLDELKSWYAQMGLPTLPSGFPAQALGIDETLRSMTSAFSVFACGGVKFAPHIISLITDMDGEPIYDDRRASDYNAGPIDTLFILHNNHPKKRRIMGKDVAYLIKANLRNVVLHGTGRRAARMKHQAFGKTGTLPFDVWFIGWTHDVAAGVWIGADQRQRYLGASRAKSYVYGANTALPVWVAFQEGINRDMPVFDDLQDVPDGVVLVNIDPDWGVLATQDQGIPIPHLVGTQPMTFAPAPGNNMEELLMETRF